MFSTIIGHKLNNAQEKIGNIYTKWNANGKPSEKKCTATAGERSSTVNTSNLLYRVV